MRKRVRSSWCKLAKYSYNRYDSYAFRLILTEPEAFSLSTLSWYAIRLHRMLIHTIWMMIGHKWGNNFKVNDKNCWCFFFNSTATIIISSLTCSDKCVIVCSWIYCELCRCCLAVSCVYMTLLNPRINIDCLLLKSIALIFDQHIDMRCEHIRVFVH